MNISKFATALLLVIAFQFFVVNTYAQIDPAVAKAQKKAEKARKKAEKDAMRQHLVDLYNGTATEEDAPSKAPKPPKEKKATATKEKKDKAPKEKNSGLDYGAQKTAKTNTKEPKYKEATPVTKPAKEAVVKAQSTVRTPPPAYNLMSAPTGQCKYSYNTIDEFTAKRKIATANQSLFTYTEEELRKFMKEKEFLTCNGFISEIAGIKILNMEFIFDSPYAKQEYGPIQSGSSLIIRLINGETVALEAQQFDPGTKNLQKLKTYYSNVYLIPPKAEKELRKAEVDAVRMVWGTGYEDYEVYELDFFIDQFNCLDAAN